MKLYLSTLTRVFATSLRRVRCWIFFHHWTCASEEGIPPTQKQLDDGIEGFNEYATMYCKFCGKVYVPDRR